MKGSKPGYFLDFSQRYYEGWWVVSIVGMRVLPRIGMVVMALNTGIIGELAEQVPLWMIQLVCGFLCVAMVLFLCLRVYEPYSKLRNFMTQHLQPV